jgi:hypothetical protein
MHDVSPGLRFARTNPMTRSRRELHSESTTLHTPNRPGRHYTETKHTQLDTTQHTKHARLFTNILLLILVMLTPYVDHANPRAHLLELQSSECLGQYVSQLIISSHLANLNLSLFCTLPQQVILDFNVLASSTQHRITDQLNTGLQIKATAEQLSTLRLGTTGSKPSSSPRTLCSHNAWQVALAAATYSTSQLD